MGNSVHMGETKTYVFGLCVSEKCKRWIVDMEVIGAVRVHDIMFCLSFR